MKTVEQLMKEIQGVQASIQDAHEEIDDYYSGRNRCPMIGFGPYAQSQRIAWGRDRLEELRKELRERGLTEEKAVEITREAPACGDVYEACMEFLKNIGAA